MKALQLYNTMTRQVENFVPQNPPKVSLYACGLTVYDYTHLGHLRKYTMDDILIRTLEHFGYEVTFVQNVTDVGHLASDADSGEDKLEKGAKKYGESVYDIARKFEEYFFNSMDTMGNLRPAVSCRATDHIQAQLAMVVGLEEKGFTYVIEDDGVYFDTSKLDDYGMLARLDLENLKEGAGGSASVAAGKRNPTDFALWKFERPGENRAMVWPSPWHPRSFPGWHIECSAMSMEYLGNQIDIHTGGIDHIPVHHTNEIAQAEAFSGKKPFVRFWVHHNFLQVEGEKMSKSLGNFYTIDDILERGFHPKALRLLFLGSHYRSELNFTWNSLVAAQTALEKMVGQFAQLHSEPAEKDVELSAAAKELHVRFEAALAHDLNTAEAVALVWEVLKSNVSDAEKRRLLEHFDSILQIGIAELAASGEISKKVSLDAVPEVVAQLVARREVARSEKQWQEADDLRKKIEAEGYEVIDSPDGQELQRR